MTMDLITFRRALRRDRASDAVSLVAYATMVIQHLETMGVDTEVITYERPEQAMAAWRNLWFASTLVPDVGGTLLPDGVSIRLRKASNIQIDAPLAQRTRLQAAIPVASKINAEAPAPKEPARMTPPAAKPVAQAQAVTPPVPMHRIVLLSARD
jgi:hypothetical protein